ncbi:MAG: hypothetical protein B7733_05705 [Myxococcales bacterium FL481]|nr:MAG: hypothetical protein B7733_05705 [Myxococcales bacterium FL481]
MASIEKIVEMAVDELAQRAPDVVLPAFHLEGSAVTAQAVLAVLDDLHDQCAPSREQELAVVTSAIAVVTREGIHLAMRHAIDALEDALPPHIGVDVEQYTAAFRRVIESKLQ